MPRPARATGIRRPVQLDLRIRRRLNRPPPRSRLRRRLPPWARSAPTPLRRGRIPHTTHPPLPEARCARARAARTAGRRRVRTDSVGRRAGRQPRLGRRRGASAARNGAADEFGVQRDGDDGDLLRGGVFRREGGDGEPGSCARCRVAGAHWGDGG